MKHLYKFLAACVLSVFALSQALAQCAMCRTTVENNVSAGDTSLASGLNMGIIYLFVSPYLLVAVIAFFWYRKSKKEHGKKIRLVRHSR